MATQSWATILQAMGRTYPGPIDFDAVCRDSGFDDAQVRRAVWELVDRGFVEVQGSPSWLGLPWSVSRLTEAGLAVAFGLAAVDDAGSTLRALEAATVHELDRQRAQQSSPFVAGRRCAGPQDDADLPRTASARPPAHSANDAVFDEATPQAWAPAGGRAAALSPGSTRSTE